jgi:hypothetical protein
MDLTLLFAQALAILAFIALVLAMFVFVRRGARFVAESRDAERFRRSLGDITKRAAAVLEEIGPPIDGVRRRSVAAETLVDDLARTGDAIAGLAREARLLHGPEPAGAIREALVIELERAGRAIEMVEHGCTILAAARSDTRAPEGQTSIKRGYLNILHARDAILAHGARAPEVVVGEPWRLFQPPNP